VNLLAPEQVEEFQTKLTEAYVDRYATRPTFYHCVPAAGAGRTSQVTRAESPS
jgi:galactokinase